MRVYVTMCVTARARVQASQENKCNGHTHATSSIIATTTAPCTSQAEARATRGASVPHASAYARQNIPALARSFADGLRVDCAATATSTSAAAAASRARAAATAAAVSPAAMLLLRRRAGQRIA